MAGMDDNVAIIGDWVPPSPSPRAFFSSMLVDERSFLESPGSNKSEDFFLGSREGNSNGKNSSQGNGAGNELTAMGSFSQYKSNSRGGLVERIAARAGFNAPRLNTESIRSSDLSLNSEVRSPYLTIPPGLSPTSLLDSPVFLSNSLAQPSPTTGKFPFVSNCLGRSSTLLTEASDKTNFFEDINNSFAFKPHGESGSFFLGPTSKQSFPSIEVSVQSDNSSQSMEPAKVQTQDQNHNQNQNQNANNFQLPPPDFSHTSTEKDNGENTASADPRAFDTVGGSTGNSPPVDEQPEEEGDQRGGGDSMVAGGGTASEDGYNWRKYGQKQVKGSEYPRSYYKCTHPNCLVKKKVERSHEGHITEIIYKGAHNHPKPPPSRRSGATGPINPLIDMRSEVFEQGGPQTGADGDLVWGSSQKANGGASDWKHDNLEVTSSASVGHDYCQQSTSMQAQNGAHLESGDVVDASSTFSNDEDEDDRGTHGSVSLAYDGEGDESESKRRKIEAYATEMSGATRAIREPRVVVQTTSEVDILDDGYRWRKYGQKVVKGNPNPRSYYKCTNAGCSVRKHVERASHDLKSVITTYEGKHNHDVPAARNSSHVNSGPSGNMSGQASGSAAQTHPHRPEPSQVHDNMARFERPMSMGSFNFPGRQQLGPAQGFSFGMNQPGLANLAMSGFGPGQHKVPVLPVHHPYFAQQRQFSEMSFMLPKGEPKVEPMSEPGLNMSNASAVYQQLMNRLPLGP